MIRLRMEGLAELYAGLRALPGDLAREGGAIVVAHAEDAKNQIQAEYHEGPTGNLRRGVVVDRASSGFGARAIVRSRAPHAWMYESGSAQRRTERGANRGRMPALHAFIPIVIKVRAQMVRSLIGLVERAGFQVAA